VVVNKIMQLKSKGKRFSLTFDEWISVYNRRYLNISVCSDGGILWNIGLVHVYGTMSAENYLKLLEKKIGEYGLCLSKEVICVTTDGALVMTKFGKLIDAEQQICLVHVILLAVRDVLYKSIVNEEKSEFNIFVESEQDDDDDDDDVDTEGGVIVAISPACAGPHYLNYSCLYPLVTKIRIVVRIFRSSPTKNGKCLQNYIAAEFGNPETHWNSLLSILE
jgi:hypothetical protein